MTTDRQYFLDSLKYICERTTPYQRRAIYHNINSLLTGALAVIAETEAIKQDLAIDLDNIPEPTASKRKGTRTCEN